MSQRSTEVLRNATSTMQQLAERVDAELAFARSLTELHSSKAKSLNAAIAAAEKKAAEVFASADLAQMQKGVGAIEKLLAPAADLAKTYTIYCVGHAHIDMNWMWGWPETVSITNDTFTTVLKLMDEFPTFVFSQSQASVYTLVQQYNPALFDAIRQRVKEGRWEVTASHWVEGDRNMVSGESLTRHLLYTRRYFKEFFDLNPEDVQIDWSPDTFGHPLTVPMYLTRGGVKYVYLHRPGAMGVKRPSAFWWQSPDGAKVLVRNDMANGYNGQLNPGIANPLVNFCKETGLAFTMFVYGVGDHGGGPTRRDLAMAVDMDTWPIFPNVKFARASDFYARLEKEGGKLPTLTCELNTELTGCFTTQALIKRCNRVAEHRLLDAETACTVAAAATGRPYPAKDLELAWRDTLFCHFHDILPGSNVHDSRTWMHGLFQKTIATTTMAETLALRELAMQVDTASGVVSEATPAISQRATLGAGVGWGADRNMLGHTDQAGGPVKPLVVFNPCAWDRAEVIEATIWSDSSMGQVTDEMRNRPLSVYTPGGKLIPAQKLEHGNYWNHAFVRIAFPVKVPALGYATYTVVEQPCDAITVTANQITSPHHCSYSMQDRRKEGIKNDFLEVQIDPETGGILRLDDKRNGLSWNGPWHLEYLLEKPHGMTAWVIDNAVKKETLQVLAIDRKLDNAYKATVDVRLKIRESEFTLTYELRAGDPMLYLHLKGTWFERGTPQTGVPTLHFTMPLSDMDSFPHGTYEIPFGAIERDTHEAEELPALNWAMVTGTNQKKPSGLLLLNDCKHGHWIDGNTFNLTLIRSAYEPDPLPDVGQHEIHLGLLPFSAKLSTSDAIRMGKSFNRPLRPVGTSLHSGKLPSQLAGVQMNDGNVLITTVKQAEEGGVILHLVNPSTKDSIVAVTLNPQLLGEFSRAEEIDLLERPVKPSGAKLQKQTLSVKVKANAIACVKLTQK